ncbi:MAG: hypothetical protein ACI9EF_001403 [Pseudohongiellaceae bacterium]|jgi:hypothetical protein
MIKAALAVTSILLVTITFGDLRDMHLGMAADVGYDPAKSRKLSDVGASGHGITEIGIERGHSPWNIVPKYTAFISSDGTIRYEGIRHPEREGIYEGQITDSQFNELAWFIKTSGYLDLEHTYTLAAGCGASVYTTVLWYDQRKIVKNYAGAGPNELWAVEMLIDATLDGAEWKRLGRAGK